MNGTLARALPTDGAPRASQPSTGTPDRSIVASAPAPHQALRLTACVPFQAVDVDALQDQATAGQDPDIGATPSARTLSAMPSSPTPAAWHVRARRWLAQWFRTLAGPSSPSPATGRSTVRLPFPGRGLGFREFTVPRRPADGGPSRLRVKATGFSARIARLPAREPR